MIKKLLTAGIVFGILGGASIALAAFNSTGGGTYYLQASISSSQNTITLSSFTEPISGNKYTMLYLNTDIVYGTIAPQSDPNEFISFTGIVQNANGTATLTGVTRGLGRSYPFAASTTLAKPFPGQTRFILSSPPEFYNEYAARRNTQSITGTWSFSPTAKPQYSSNPTFGAGDGNAFVNYSTLIATAISGAGTSTEGTMGIVQLATSAQVSAGTASSTTGAPLVIKSGSATSTCQVALPGVLAASSTTGKLGGNCLDTTYSYPFSGLETFSGGLITTASSTFNATTSISASNVTNNALRLNGVSYSWPSTLGASSTVPSTDALGNIHWVTAPASVTSTTTTLSPSTSSQAATSKTVYCVLPKVVSGGGWSGMSKGSNTNPSSTYTVTDSYPSATNAWTVAVACSGPGTCGSNDITIYAMCVNP